MIENKIKDIIIEKYGSVKRFSTKIDVPYTTIDTILKRGLMKSNTLNVIKICKELDIDIDELANNRLVFKKVMLCQYTKQKEKQKMVDNITSE